MSGLNLKIERLKQQLSQWDLAGLTGIPNYRLSLLETGRAIPSDDEIDLLCKALEMKPEHISDKSEG